MPPGTKVPEGFKYVDFPAVTVGVCWLHGKMDEVFKREEECMKRLEKDGMKNVPGKDGAYWFMERYGCPRFTTPDSEGKVILDICCHIAP